MQIKYFSWLKNITNSENEIFESNEINSTKELQNYLINKYPELKIHFENKLIRIAVNKEYIVEDISLKEQDEIAIFPPVSGG